MRPEEVLERARRSMGKGCTYVLGAGGMHPEAEGPWRISPAGVYECDCSGFAMWAFGLSRFLEGLWYDTTHIAHDALTSRALFDHVATAAARPSDLIVYPDHEGHQGHVGVVTSVGEAGPVNVCHCSHGNYVAHGDAIGESNANLWLGHAGIIARCKRLEVA